MFSLFRIQFIFSLFLAAFSATAYGILTNIQMGDENIKILPQKTDLPSCFQSDSKREYPISVVEPSGIAYNPVGDNLFVVSDEGGVYIITKDGTFIRMFAPIPGDLEGVAFDESNEAILVAEERQRQVIALAPTGETILVMPIDLLGYNNFDNRGIEGIALNSKSGDLYVSKERQPNFIIRIPRAGDPEPFRIEGLPDIADLFYDSETKLLWVLSRGDQSIHFVNESLETACRPFHFGIEDVEGLTRDKEGNLYLVADRNQIRDDKLYVFLPQKKIEI